VTVNNPEIDETIEKVKEEELEKPLIFNPLSQKSDLTKEKHMEVISITYPVKQS
jgi:hypothetical protein